jgi:hypothetical protein
MPEVSRFYGIVITLNYNDHAPPHFHARYGSESATVTIDGRLLAGSLPARALVLVSDWAAAHREELLADWELARQQLPLVPIAPID